MYEFANKELEQKIKAAETSGRYLIIITRVALDEKKTLQHWWGMRDFSRKDILSTLCHIEQDIQRETPKSDKLNSSKWQ